MKHIVFKAGVVNALLTCLMALFGQPALGDIQGSTGDGDRQAEIYHSPEERREAGRGTEIGERIYFLGLIEIEASFERIDGEDGTEKSLDAVLATAQVGIDADLMERLSAGLVLVYEEGESGVSADEALLSWKPGSWDFRLGLQDLPTGVYPSHMISGPLTESLGETTGLSFIGLYGNELFSVKLFLARGDIGEAGTGERIDDWGVSVETSPLPALSVNAAWFADLAESDAGLAQEYEEPVGGWSASVVLELGDMELLGEYLTANGRFHPDDLDHNMDGRGDRPRAWNAEAAWAILDILEIAARIEGSDEFPEEPELQYGGCISWSPLRSVSLSLEYLRGEFDGSFGDGITKRDLVTTQVALEF